MGVAEWFSDMLESLPWPQDVYAEAPAEDEEENKDEGDGEEKQESGDNKEEGGEEKEEGVDDSEEKEEGGDDEAEEQDDEEEEEEEEEEEPEDPMPKLQEECARSAQCIGYKHHYEECVERVTAQHEDENYKGPKEDCVEEFFHLTHCASQCAAPKLFKILK